MPIELTAKTETGARLVRQAETLAGEFATRAGAHDREATYPFTSIEALHETRYFAAAVPVELGGLGVTSVHDLVVAASRLARGDASVAIGVNMHTAVVRNIARRWQVAVRAGNERRAAAFGAALDGVAHEGVVIATAVSEPGQDITRPATTATRTPAGWRVDGRKIFCTMSPAATVLYTSVRFVDPDRGERYGYARVPADAPGVLNHDDWDAMGMRASGSHSITFDGVALPESALGGGFPTGSPHSYMGDNLTAGLFHASSSLGIAESADLTTTDALRDRTVDARAQMLLAENAVDLSAARGALGRAAELIDAHWADADDREAREQVPSLFAEAQAVKTFVNEAAVRTVDRALALSGGAGYLNGHPLARAYRDVRAGAFMHPLGANRAYELLGEVALGREPVLH
jgi:alkylation response protein AidB-like acyl-CoA dehydrogenase